MEKNCMYKKDFIAELAQRANVDSAAAERAVDAFLEILTEQWCAHGSVHFYGFGVFESHPTTERLARNPMTMEDVMIPAGYKPIFRPSRLLRSKVNGDRTK